MTKYYFTTFKSRTLTAKSVEEVSMTFDDTPERHGLFDGLHALKEWEYRQGKNPYWGGGRYTEQHNSESWQGTSSLNIEYAREYKDHLRDRLNDMPWHWFMNDTKGDVGKGVLVTIPFDNEITKASTYTRIASLIADDLGLFQGARQGSDAITYLWQWDHAGKPIEERPECGFLLDAQAYFDKNAGIGRNQIKFEHHVGIVTCP